MLSVLFFIISALASTIGAISGIGGGVIIKPVLDATGTLGVGTISFLSGCTVLSMSIISLIRSRNNGVTLEVKKSTFLALGAASGGIIGKSLFDLAQHNLANENILGAFQAVILLLITVGVYFYIRYKEHITTKKVESVVVCIVIGLLLGVISSFLGIGGGPINIAVLYYFFSMDSKTAALNSIYIILFSQITSLLNTFIKGTVPTFEPLTLCLMIVGGITGAFVGSSISKKLSSDRVEKIFMGLLVVLVFINIYNIVRFSL